MLDRAADILMGLDIGPRSSAGAHQKRAGVARITVALAVSPDSTVSSPIRSPGRHRPTSMPMLSTRASPSAR